MAEVLVSAAAEGDYIEALRWYAERSAAAALNFERRITEALFMIGRTPDAFPKCDASHRFYRVRPYPYQVIFRDLADGRWLIVAFAHLSRRPRFWLHRG